MNEKPKKLIFGIPQWLLDGLEIDPKSGTVQQIVIRAENESFLEVAVRYYPAERRSK